MSHVKNESLKHTLQSVGILVDESYFVHTEELINEVATGGIRKENISVLIYKDRIKKTETFAYPAFSLADVSWDGNITKPEVKAFENKNFDLLINYYDVEKAALLMVSCDTKAEFRVGFTSIDKKLNHFMIDTAAENFKVFTEEMFRYLKILNKI